MKRVFALPTSDEIDRRLRIVSELRNLCLSLGKARRLEQGEVELREVLVGETENRESMDASTVK